MHGQMNKQQLQTQVLFKWIRNKKQILTVIIDGVINQHPSIHMSVSLPCHSDIIQLAQDSIAPSIRLSCHFTSHEVGIKFCLRDQEVQFPLLPSSLW